MKQSIGSGRGSVYNIILKALQSGDKYGYEICQEIETNTNGHYILKQPSLYSGLKRLEAQKLVKSYWGDSEIGGRRHYYTLTEEGRRKIEKSNFSWEDERNDIMENFFKKSESDQDIEDIKKSIQEVSENVESASKENQAVNQVLSSAPTKDDTYQAENNQFDLFSFASFYGKQQDSEPVAEDKTEENQQTELQPAEEKQEITQEETPSVFTANSTAPQSFVEPEKNASLEEKPDEKPTEQTVQQEPNIVTISQENTTKSEENNQTKEDALQEPQSAQMSIFDFDYAKDNFNNEKQEIKQEQSVAVEEKPQVNDTQDVDIDFDELFSRKKATSFASHVEEKQATPVVFSDLEKSSTFYGSNDSQPSQLDDKFDEKYENFKKMFENSYETTNEHQENTQQKTLNQDAILPTQPVSQTSSFDEEERLRQEQEKRMSDALSGNLGQHNYDDLKVTSSSVINEVSQSENTVNNEQITQNSQVTSNQEIDSDSLKNIFKDFIKEEPKPAQENPKIDQNAFFRDDERYEDYQSFNNTNFGGKDVSLDSRDETPKQTAPLKDDLPRYDYSNNVNLSLEADRPTKSTYYRSTTQESYDSYQKQEPVQNNYNFNTNFNSNNLANKPFNEKVTTAHTPTANYKIRYLRKNNVETAPTKFTAINKLNLSVFALFCLISIGLTLGLFFGVSAHTNITPAQNAFYIINIVLCVTILFYYVVNFIKDKDYKIEYEFNKKYLIKSLVLCALLIVAVVILNIVCGMTAENIMQYSASLIIPTADLVMIGLMPVIKHLFNKIPYYAK